MSKKNDKNRICLCAIAGAFGIKGAVRLKPFTADPLSVADYGPLTNEDGTQEFELSNLSLIKGGVSAQVKNVQNRNQAEDLRGLRLYINRAQLPDLPEDEYYYSDLLGLEIENLSGEILGKVKAIQDHGAGDIIEVMGPNGVFDIAFTRASVPYVDIANRKLVVDILDDAPKKDNHDA